MPLASIGHQRCRPKIMLKFNLYINMCEKLPIMEWKCFSFLLRIVRYDNEITTNDAGFFLFNTTHVIFLNFKVNMHLQYSTSLRNYFIEKSFLLHKHYCIYKLRLNYTFLIDLYFIGQCPTGTPSFQ